MNRQAVETAAESMLFEARGLERAALRAELARDDSAWGRGYDRATVRHFRDHARSLRRHAADILDALEGDTHRHVVRAAGRPLRRERAGAA